MEKGGKRIPARCKVLVSLQKNQLLRLDTMSKRKEGFACANDGTEIHYDYIPAPGGGPTLVLCNGILCINSFWVYLIEYFEGRYPILTWDYRGHGRSELPRDFDSLTVPNHAGDLAAVMDAAGVEEAVLFGFSMGVQLSFEFYNQTPERVLGIIAVSGSEGKAFNLYLGTDLLEGLVDRFFNLAERLSPVLEFPINLFLRSPLIMPAARLVGIDRHRGKKSDMMPYFNHLVQINKLMSFKALRHLNEHSAAEVLSNVKVPTLIIMGTNDHMTPPAHALKLNEKIPGSELFMVPHGKHAAIIENPRAINCRIELFLRDYFDFSASLSPDKREKTASKDKR